MGYARRRSQIRRSLSSPSAALPPMMSKWTSASLLPTSVVTIIVLTFSRAVPTQAGSYVIRATVGGHNVPGWPQPLHVEAGLSDAAQCWLTGPPLQVCS
jgi:hypothetical protein